MTTAPTTTSTTTSPMTRQRLHHDSLVWEQAKKLMAEQEHLRKRLQIMFQNKLPSGLYQDENDDTDDTKFPAFVQHVRSFLSRSPRTILRQAMHEAFHQRLVMKHNNNQNNKDDLKRLCHLLGLPTDLHPTTTRMHVIAKRVQALSTGKRYQQLIHAQESLSTNNKRRPLYEKDHVAFRQKILDGCRKKKHFKYIQTKHKEEDNEEEEEASLSELDEIIVVQRAIDKSIEKEKYRQSQLFNKVQSLTQQLQEDIEYQTYCEVHDLWEKTGAKHLWEAFLQVDLAICRSRGERGIDFEINTSELCFAMIVVQWIIISQKNLNNNKNHHQGNSSSSSSSSSCYDDYSYETNVHWWNHQGERVGEIDIIIFERNDVIAICELKSSCFEIAQAMRQHESKILSSSNHHPSLLLNHDGDSSDSYYWMGRTFADLSFPLQGHDPTIQLFVATLVSTSDHDFQEDMLGAEPKLSNAICEGLRDQGLGLADQDTAFLSRPLVDDLLGDPTTLNVQNVIEYLTSIEGKSGHYLYEESIDYLQLENFVKDRLGLEALMESPAGCLQRCANQILIIER